MQVLIPEKSLSLKTAISDLLSKVQQLQNETDSLICNCDRQDCPFVDKKLCTPSLKDLPPLHTVLTKRNRTASDVLPGNLNVTMSFLIERRGDGTIIEKDGPTKISCEESLEKRLRKSSMLTTSGQHLSVLNTVTHSRNDCEVDNENLFGTLDDTLFTRIDPKRKHVRVTQRNRRRITLEMGSVSKRSHKLQTHTNSKSLSSLPRNTLQAGSVTSLPSYIMKNYYEDYEISSVSSDSSV